MKNSACVIVTFITPCISCMLSCFSDKSWQAMALLHIMTVGNNSPHQKQNVVQLTRLSSTYIRIIRILLSLVAETVL